MKKGRNKYRTDNSNEEFYYACICDFWMVTATSHSKARVPKYFKAKVQGYTRTFGKMKHFRDLWARIASTHHYNITIHMDWWNLRAPICTLQLPAWEGCMELLDMHAKWITLYRTRCLKQTETLCAITAEVLATWKHFLTTDNPPNLRATARDLEYIRIFFRECYEDTAGTLSYANWIVDNECSIPARLGEVGNCDTLHQNTIKAALHRLACLVRQCQPKTHYNRRLAYEWATEKSCCRLPIHLEVHRRWQHIAPHDILCTRTYVEGHAQGQQWCAERTLGYS